MNTTRVGNIRKDDRKTGEKVVRVCRPSQWGNPFPYDPKEKKPRIEAIKDYIDWLLYHEDSPLSHGQSLDELKGKRLLCFCHPQMCHAHVLAVLADGCTRNPEFIMEWLSRYWPEIYNGAKWNE